MKLSGQLHDQTPNGLEAGLAHRWSGGGAEEPPPPGIKPQLVTPQSDNYTPAPFFAKYK